MSVVSIEKQRADTLARMQEYANLVVSLRMFGERIYTDYFAFGLNTGDNAFTDEVIAGLGYPDLTAVNATAVITSIDNFKTYCTSGNYDNLSKIRT